MPVNRTIGWMLLTAAAYGQTGPRFEVASIKATAADQYNGSSGITTKLGRLTGNRVTLKRCIVGAYGVGPSQIVGGPPWLDSDKFEIAAKADRPAGDDDLMLMLRALLAERFQLALRRETRNLDALSLEVVRNGPKLTKVEGGDSSTNSSRGRIEAKATGMSLFANILSRTMGVPVVDATGLEGAFDFQLAWSPEADRPVRPGEAAPEGLSLLTAIQEQLGLRLRARKAAVEVLVIEHAEKPTDN